MSELRDWAGLPDSLLHSIVELLGSFPDLLAFAATCHPWHSAFSSYPSKSTLYTLFTPLLLNPNVSFCPHRPFPNVARNTTVPKRPCYVIDIGSQDTLLCSHIPLLSFYCRNNPPPSPLDKFSFIGASFGHMIFSSNKTCFIFDVFTGIEVLPPPLPAVGNTKLWYGAALTGPLPSPSSHLILYTESSNFFWRDGSDSWSECTPRNRPLTKFVVFKGQVIGMVRSGRSLFMVHLTPQICLQEIPISWGGNNSMTKLHLCNPRLVVCGDMLLMVGCRKDSHVIGSVFEAYRLDTLTELAKWVKVERLEKWAIVISNDSRVQPLSCMNPERWGGRSSRVYCYDSGSGHLVAFELGKPLHRDDAPKCDVFSISCHGSMVQHIWIVPSMFSPCCYGQ